MANDFKSRSTDLTPREMRERAARPADLPPEALIAILLKTGAAGCHVVELSRRLLSAFGGLRELLKSDWRMLEERIAEHNRTCPDRPILGIGHVKCLELAAAFELGDQQSHPPFVSLRSRIGW